jgi:hypothetical protein
MVRVSPRTESISIRTVSHRRVAHNPFALPPTPQPHSPIVILILWLMLIMFIMLDKLLPIPCTPSRRPGIMHAYLALAGASAAAVQSRPGAKKGLIDPCGMTKRGDLSRSTAAEWLTRDTCHPYYSLYVCSVICSAAIAMQSFSLQLR